MSQAHQVVVKSNYKLKKKIDLAAISQGLYKSRYLYLIFFPVIVFYVVFNYVPMYGLLIAFQDYSPVKGIWGSPWVGLKHVQTFMSSIYFWRLLWNTIGINVYGLIVGFPAPIILALAINEMKRDKFKRTVQTIVYLPNFISTVVVAGMIIAFLSPSSGVVNHLITVLGGTPIHFLAEPAWFKTMYVWSGVWQSNRVGINYIPRGIGWYRCTTI